MYNLLSNVGNQSRGAVLAKHFPCLMSQWITRFLCGFFNELEMCMWELSTETKWIETDVVRLQVASIFGAPVISGRNLLLAK